MNISLYRVRYIFHDGSASNTDDLVGPREFADMSPELWQLVSSSPRAVKSIRVEYDGCTAEAWLLGAGPSSVSEKCLMRVPYETKC